MKFIGKSSVSSALGAVLTYVFLISIVLCFLSFAYLAGGLIKPELVSSDRHYETLLELKPNHEIAEIAVAPSWIQETDKLFGVTLSYRSGNRLTALFQSSKFLLTSLALLFIVLQLRLFFESLSNGNPFIADNVKRLKRIGWTLLAVHLFLALCQLLETAIVSKSIHFTNATVEMTSELTMAFLMEHVAPTTFMAMVILIIAEVFRIGVRNQEEQDLTI